MKHVVHFRLSDGSIVGKVSGPVDAKKPINNEPGLGQVDYDGSREDFLAVHWDTHKVDPKSGVVVEKTAEEKRRALLPAHGEIMALIDRELLMSDRTQLPDYPISDDMRKKWIVYRQALRDFSKQKDAAWPLRPDGTSALKEFVRSLPATSQPTRS